MEVDVTKYNLTQHLERAGLAPFERHSVVRMLYYIDNMTYFNDAVVEARINTFLESEAYIKLYEAYGNKVNDHGGSIAFLQFLQDNQPHVVYTVEGDW